MKTKVMLILILSIISISLSAQKKAKTNLYSFKVKTIDGKDFDLSTLKGKKVLVVNTASKCGLTPQYKELEELHKMYGNSPRFAIIAFPANNFKEQEPGSNAEIKAFCEKNYGVTFLVMEKISVKGADIHPLYKWLTTKAENGVMDAPVQWNFQKFMIDRNGNFVGFFDPQLSPMSEKIQDWVRSEK
ncbi:MAG: glutathione peroxidase [Bacteroidetes bacterium]|nr:glutathione peroxidase [Bacteroidota bacterium]